MTASSPSLQGLPPLTAGHVENCVKHQQDVEALVVMVKGLRGAVLTGLLKPEALEREMTKLFLQVCSLRAGACELVSTVQALVMTGGAVRPGLDRKRLAAGEREED